MRSTMNQTDLDDLTQLDRETTEVLGPSEERAILRALAECKRILSEALAAMPDALPAEGNESQALAHYVAATCSGEAASGARLGAVCRRYNQLRSKLALANMRLVAHVAKKFRDRGVAYSDLLQEGFCGLLEAIDRFDLNHETKLSTYATWWIRQSMQKAVASCAYPVRLTPRHLRDLARCQDALDAPSGEIDSASEMIRRIHSATRPTVSLDATIDTQSTFSLLQTMSDPEGDQTDDLDNDETVSSLLDGLRPREQEVLALRFGLGGRPKLSLSQVGKVMSVSKERVRQIQDRAIEKLRGLAEEHYLTDALLD